MPNRNMILPFVRYANRLPVAESSSAIKIQVAFDDYPARVLIQRRQIRFEHDAETNNYSNYFTISSRYISAVEN